MGKDRGPKDGAMIRKLLFAEEYAVDFNARGAAKRSGFDPKEHLIGYRLLADPDVKARIREIMAERSNDLYVDQRWVMQKLLDVHSRCTPDEDEEGGESKKRFESAGANKALELIGKHLGMFSDKFIHESTSKMSNEDLIRAAEAIVKSRAKDQ